MNNKNLRKIDTTATVATIAALGCWSVGPVFIRYLAGFIDAWSQNLLRYVAAALFWLPLLLWALKNNKVDSRIWRRALVPAGANIIMQSFWAMSFYYIEPAFMNLLSKSHVLWIAGFSLIFFADERGLVHSKRFWSGLFLCLLGLTGVIVFKKDFAMTGTLTGIILTLAAGMTWGVYTIAVRISLKDIDSRIGFSVISVYSIVGFALLAFLFGKPAVWADLNLRLWSFIIVSGVLSIALAHVLYYTAIKRIGATIPSQILLSTPFSVLAISWFVFGETLTVLQWLSGLILVIGSGLAIWTQRHLR